MSGFEIFTGIFGGLGLFLYGMKLMGDGLENVAGEKLKGILEKITNNMLKTLFTLLPKLQSYDIILMYNKSIGEKS